VGILAESIFRYQPAASSTSVAALGKAVFMEITLLVTICYLAYTALY
jgi:hypothetical protein